MNLRPTLIRDTALQVRHDAALRALAQVDVDERVLILSYVVWPTPDLAAYSEQRARDQLLDFKGQQWTSAA